MEENKYTINQLIKAAREGMRWTEKELPKKTKSHVTAEKWVESERISPGIFPIKSAAMYDAYCKWCGVNGITGSTVLSANELGKFLAETFDYTIKGNSKYYFINKQYEEDEEKKKERKEKFRKKNKGKKDQKQT